MLSQSKRTLLSLSRSLIAIGHLFVHICVIQAIIIFLWQIIFPLTSHYKQNTLTYTFKGVIQQNQDQFTIFFSAMRYCIIHGSTLFIYIRILCLLNNIYSFYRKNLYTIANQFLIITLLTMFVPFNRPQL